MDLISEKNIKIYIFVLTIILITLLYLLLRLDSRDKNKLEEWSFNYSLSAKVDKYLDKEADFKAKGQREITKVNKLRTALLLYIRDYNKFPKKLDDLVGEYLKSIPKESRSKNDSIVSKLDYSGGWYYSPLSFNERDLKKTVQEILKTNLAYNYENDKFLGPYSILVRTKEKRLYFMEGEKKIKSYPIGIGSNETPTPIGSFRLKNKFKNFDKSREEFGDYWLGIDLWTKGGSYGIHGSEGIEITQQESRGCIRMENQDLRELFKYLPLQSLVVIE